MKELYTALSNAQGKIENAKKASLNPHFKSKYADLATVWDAGREVFAAEGLAVIQLPCEAPLGQVGLRTIITHKSGQSLEEKFFLPVAQANNPQAVGSALTYAKRYALLGAFGIAPEDDDGNAATGRPGTAAVAKPTAAPVDLTKTKEDILAKLSTCKTETEQRTLYSDVRLSCIDEPHKTELLTRMGDIIRAGLTAGKGKK